MVMLPLYQALYATFSQNGARCFVLMNDGRSCALDLPLTYPSCNISRDLICGVGQKNGKDTVSIFPVKLFGGEETSLFSLSDTDILYPCFSSDNQKIAFVARNRESGKAVLRIIKREEFGWFPVPYLKIPVLPSSVCFADGEKVVYTGTDGKLAALMLLPRSRFRTVMLDMDGVMPVYSVASKALAFVRNKTIFVRTATERRFDLSESPSFLNFSNDGKTLYYGTKTAVFCLKPSNGETVQVLQTNDPVTWYANI